MRNLSKYYQEDKEAQKIGFHLFDVMPASFIFDEKMEDLEEFKKCFDDHKNTRMHQKQCEKNIWLAKPSQGSAGTGIQVLSDYDKIIELVSQPLAKGQNWVVQKYVEKPILYNNRKFDIRVWVLCTNQNDVYIFDTFYTRNCAS